MDIPGLMNIGKGSLWFVGGLLVTVVSYEIAPGGIFVVAGGAMFGGMLQVFVGLVQYVKFVSKNRADQLMPHATKELRALIRAMMAMAKSDGELEKRELDVIRAIIANVTNNEIGWGTVNDVCTEVALEQKPITIYLAEKERGLDEDVKKLIIRCSFMIAVSDGKIAEDELTLLLSIGQALRIDAADVHNIIEEVLASTISSVAEQAKNST